jgi:hypothetical protein
MGIDQVVVKEALVESLTHAVAMAPALLLVFILMEVISHGARHAHLASALRHNVAGPVAAAGLGLLPQCGFSVAATMLYVERMIPAGSVLASYIATSDEAVPILVANPATLPWVLPLIAAKFVWGIAVGSGVNVASQILRKARAGKRSRAPESPGSRRETSPGDRHAHSHSGGGSCVGEKAYLRDYLPHALYRTARTVAMVFVLSSLLHLAGEFAHDRLPGALAASAAWQPLAASLVGLIPSCATSVALAEGFSAGVVSFPALLAGLTANSGMGLLVLFKESRDRRRSTVVTALLVASAYLAGALAQLFL